MSRLDSFIRRMTAQRDILNQVANQALLPESGNILELGLGNGRTYSHLREIFPERRIIVFDRAVMAHSSCIPQESNIVLGEIAETAKGFIGSNAAFAVDSGGGTLIIRPWFSAATTTRIICTTSTVNRSWT